MTTTIATTADFNFDHFTDEQLRETFELWAPTNLPGDQWAELYEVGRAAIIEEAHRRALGIRKYEVEVTCYARHSSTGASWFYFETFVGTTPEFMDRYGLRLINRPCAKQGEAVGYSANGEQVTMTWQRL